MTSLRERLKTPVPAVVFGPPPHGDGTVLRRATGYALSLIDALIASHFRVIGAERLPPGPILFVANHFTRFETFVLPWLIDRWAKRTCLCLAHHALFRGRFGDYLNAVGARSTREPAIKERMADDLITGRNDWLIYPEGGMMKNKRIWEKGHFSLDSPDRQGAPHTGAALIALQAGLARARYLALHEAGYGDDLAALERRHHFTSGHLPREALTIVPITLTYHPIRPGPSIVLKLARRMFGDMPEFLKEELAVEGNLLLGKTDIHVVFGEPIPVEPYVKALMVSTGLDGAATAEAWEDERVRRWVDVVKARMTTRLMAGITANTVVNVDHLFCSALRRLARSAITVDDLHRALALIGSALAKLPGVRLHPTLADAVAQLAAGERCPSLDDIHSVAQREGAITVVGGRYLPDREALLGTGDFDRIRLTSTCAVIANELEPLRAVIDVVDRVVNLPVDRLRRSCAEAFIADETERWRRERIRHHLPSPREDQDHAGAPFLLLHDQARVGVVATHGYLAAPRESRALAERLHREGADVCGCRLTGHGSCPEALGATPWTAWPGDLRRGLACVAPLTEQVVLVGFSMGGMLSLLAAADRPDRVTAVVAINPPVRLLDRRAALAPYVSGWNHLAHRIGLDRLALDLVGNEPEWNDVNYRLNPVDGLVALEHVIAATMHRLRHVRVPVLLIQADRDPVVDPTGVDDLARALGSEEVTVERIAADHHGVLRGPDAPAVHDLVARFIDGIAGRRSSRARATAAG